MSTESQTKWREFTVKIAAETEEEFKAVRKGIRTLAEVLPPDALTSFANLIETQPDMVDRIFSALQNPMVRKLLGVSAD